MTTTQGLQQEQQRWIYLDSGIPEENTQHAAASSTNRKTCQKWMYCTAACEAYSSTRQGRPFVLHKDGTFSLGFAARGKNIAVHAPSNLICQRTNTLSKRQELLQKLLCTTESKIGWVTGPPCRVAPTTTYDECMTLASDGQPLQAGRESASVKPWLGVHPPYTAAASCTPRG